MSKQPRQAQTRRPTAKRLGAFTRRFVAVLGLSRHDRDAESAEQVPVIGFCVSLTDLLSLSIGLSCYPSDGLLPGTTNGIGASGVIRVQCGFNRP